MGKRRRLLVLGDDVAKRNLTRDRLGDQPSDLFVSLAKRDTLLHEPFGDVGGDEELIVRGPLGGGRVEGHGTVGPRHRGENQEYLADRVKEWLLVLLEIAVVGKRQSLQGHEQSGEVPHQSSTLASS